MKYWMKNNPTLMLKMAYPNQLQTEIKGIPSVYSLLFIDKPPFCSILRVIRLNTLNVKGIWENDLFALPLFNI